jgi:hypothetical protein
LNQSLDAHPSAESEGDRSMNVMVVAVFDTETAALEGLQALRNLHKEAAFLSMRRQSS